MRGLMLFITGKTFVEFAPQHIAHVMKNVCGLYCLQSNRKTRLGQVVQEEQKYQLGEMKLLASIYQHPFKTDRCNYSH